MALRTDFPQSPHVILDPAERKKIILEGAQKLCADAQVTLKADATPVTQADREAERAIVEILGRAFPEYGVLGEEFGGSGSTDVRWIVDPIDGTKNFVRGIPLWATLIALEERGEVTVGVVHNPARGDLYTARRGGGAWKNGERLFPAP